MRSNDKINRVKKDNVNENGLFLQCVSDLRIKHIFRLCGAKFNCGVLVNLCTLFMLCTVTNTKVIMYNIEPIYTVLSSMEIKK